MRTFSFEKLNVWQKSRELSSRIYAITKTFPADERFGLTSQMRRCAISISSNIAEGTSRHGTKDKARFTEISYGSTMELLNQIILSKDLNFIKEEEYAALRDRISEIAAMLDGLYKSQIK
jgi:four helix bundle protein